MLLIIFLMAALIIGYVQKTRHERNLHSRKLAAIQKRLAQIERERQKADSLENDKSDTNNSENKE